MIALVDADSILYKVGFTFQETTDWGDGEPIDITTDIQSAKNAIDGLIENIKFKTGCDDYELWLSGDNNFRYNVVEDYKHNRTKSTKPIDFDDLKRYIIYHHKAIVTNGYEADDIVVYKKTMEPDKYFVCAIDKDVLYQTAGTHYNYGSDEFIEVTPKEAIRFFYYQILVGDSTDGYSGCKGIGKVKADRILNEAESSSGEPYTTIEDSYYSRVVDAYSNSFKCNEEEAKKMVETTGRLACMHQLFYDDINHNVKLCLWSYKEGNYGYPSKSLV